MVQIGHRLSVGLNTRRIKRLGIVMPAKALPAAKAVRKRLSAQCQPQSREVFKFGCSWTVSRTPSSVSQGVLLNIYCPSDVLPLSRSPCSRSPVRRPCRMRPQNRNIVNLMQACSSRAQHFACRNLHGKRLRQQATGASI